VTDIDGGTTRERGQAGFSLIELLVVIAVLGVLAGVVVFSVGSSTDDAGAAACSTELRVLRTAVGAYRAKYDYYPSSQGSLVGEFLEDPSSMWNYSAPPDLQTGTPTYTPTGDC
jgi:general secretion pathway protein G